jgi:hypothetical protein
VKGRLADEIWPVLTVNGVAVPIAVPPELKNEMLPVQDAAVPPLEVPARLTTLIWAVSVAASPTGAKLKVRVTVPAVVVCANAEDIRQIVRARNIKTYL